MNTGALGDIKYSILEESTFQQLNGKSWILADGREIRDSDLCKLTGRSNAPDVRGLFLRAANHGRTDEYGNPENTKVGYTQQDSTRLPRNRQFYGRAEEAGEHFHKYRSNGIWGRSWKGSDSGPKTAYDEQGNTDSAGRHTHKVSINEGGDQETRPKNITFYVYIKINNQ